MLVSNKCQIVFSSIPVSILGFCEVWVFVSFLHIYFEKVLYWNAKIIKGKSLSYFYVPVWTIASVSSSRWVAVNDEAMKGSIIFLYFTFDSDFSTVQIFTSDL